MVNTLRWTGLFGMISIAVMRCAMEFVPDPFFDVDPAITPGVRAAAGPALSLALDVILMMSCAVALLGESLARRGVRWLMLLLAGIGAIPVFVHGWRDLDDLWRGSTWLAAIVGAVTAAHLARDRAMRHVMLAVLLAAAVPVMARGAVQTLYEHAHTVATFRQNADQILRQQGIEPGSASAAIYERRLMQNQPIGWFITTNVFASMMAATLIASIGLVVAAVRSRVPSGWTGAIGLVGLAAAAGLAMTGSKGAIGVAALGVPLLLLPMISTAVRRAMARFGGWIAVSLIAAVLLGVVIRGSALPESFASDTSLLFRWHYMVASTRIVADEPWLGTGPDHFQQFYTQHRLPRNPEEVASAHSIFFDWLATLGIAGGAAWIALVLIMLWRAGRVATESEPTAQHDRSDSIPPAVLACVLASLALIIALVVEWGVIASDPVIIMSRVIGVLGFLATALIAIRIADRADEPLVRWSLAAGAIALMMHSQIEMTLTQPNAVVWGLMLVGVAAAGETRRSGACSVAGLLGAIAVAAISIVIGSIGLVPAWREHTAMRGAAEMLRPIAEIRWNMNQAMLAPSATARRAAVDRITAAMADSHIPASVDSLHAALRDGPASTAFATFESAIAGEERLRRVSAATALRELGTWRALAAASEQLASVAELEGRDGGDDRRIPHLAQAVDLAGLAADRSGRPRAYSLAGSLAHRLASSTGNAAHWSRAIDHLRNLADGDPHGISAWVRLGDALWESGRREEALVAYRRALENDAMFELDPLKQLSAAERDRIRARIGTQESRRSPLHLAS